MPNFKAQIDYVREVYGHQNTKSNALFYATRTTYIAYLNGTQINNLRYPILRTKGIIFIDVFLFDRVYGSERFKFSTLLYTQ